MVCRVVILYYDDIAVAQTQRYYNVHNNIIFERCYRSISIHIIITHYTVDSAAGWCNNSLTDPIFPFSHILIKQCTVDCKYYIII